MEKLHKPTAIKVAVVAVILIIGYHMYMSYKVRKAAGQ